MPPAASSQLQILDLAPLFLGILPFLYLIKSLQQITTSGRQNKPHATSQNYREKKKVKKPIRERGDEDDASDTC